MPIKLPSIKPYKKGQDPLEIMNPQEITPDEMAKLKPEDYEIKDSDVVDLPKINPPSDMSDKSDLSSKFNDLYNRSVGVDASDYMRRMPKIEQYQPSTLNKIGATIGAMGVGALEGPSKGIASYQTQIRNPYNTAMNQWLEEGKGLKDVSELQNKDINNKSEILRTQGTLENQGKERELEGQRVGLEGQKLDFEKAQGLVKNTQFDKEFNQRAQQFGQENALNWYKAQHPTAFMMPMVTGYKNDEHGNPVPQYNSKGNVAAEIQAKGGPVEGSGAKSNRQQQKTIMDADKVEAQANHVLGLISDPEIQNNLGPALGRMAKIGIQAGDNPKMAQLYQAIENLKELTPDYKDQIAGVQDSPAQLKAIINELAATAKQNKGIAGAKASSSVADLVAEYKKKKGMQ